MNDKSKFWNSFGGARVGGSYARYVLAVLMLVYVFNFLDRHILSILAERIKRDLALSDADLGFLYGTAFAVFYAVLGIPLGRLADVWDRRRLIAIGLCFWSVMTVFSGLCQNLFQLTLARIGVAVGEASATPAAYSKLSDWFPRQQRATVLAIYSGGVYIGYGLGILIGGQLVERWDMAFGALPPFGLRGWQFAFLAVGFPGLLLALVVWYLREPPRGQVDGLRTPPHPRPFREFGRELAGVVPPATFFRLVVSGADRAHLIWNVVTAIAVAIAAIALTVWLGNPVQWAALAIGLYAFFSWAQNLRLRDPTCFALIFRAPALRFVVLYVSCMAFTGYGIGFWTAPYFIRVLGMGEGQVGTVLGLIGVIAGLLGIVSGGMLADRWRQRNNAGRLFVGMISAALLVPITLWLFTTDNKALAFVLYFPFVMLTAVPIGGLASTVQDLVLPRMRASASAAYLLVQTLVGLAMGPYTIGRLSMALGDLRSAILWALLGSAAAIVFAWLAARHIERDEVTLRDRARSAGEASVGGV